MPIPQLVDVKVQSAFWSKINWTQIIAMVAAALAIFGIPMTANEQVAVVGGITVVQSIVTIILRTWFSSTVTPQSLSPTEGKGT